MAQALNPLFLKSIALSTLIAAAACGGEPTTEAPEAQPTIVEVSAPVVAQTAPEHEALKTRFAAVTPLLATEVANEIRAGFVAMAMQDGEIIMSEAVGLADREADTPMSPDTRFRIASMTKPITSVAILMLADEGKLSIDDPLATYLPAFAEVKVATSLSANEDGVIPTTPPERPITLRHLLTHTSGIGYLFDVETDLGQLYLSKNLYAMEGDLEARINTLASLPLYSQPGEKWIYSYATDVLGRVVEVASEQSLDQFFSERIFTPLGMNDTEFSFDESDLENVAVVYAHDEAGNIIRYQGDDQGGNPNEEGAGWYSGGAGLISTASDYLAFCQMLINDGVAPDGSQLLSTASLDAVFDSQIGPAARTDEWRGQGASFSLAGWVALADPSNPDSTKGAGAFSWGGFYDTGFTINRYEKSAYVVLAQRQPTPHDKPSKANNLMRTALFGTQTNE